MDMRSYRWYRATVTMENGKYIREACYRCPVTHEFVKSDMEMSLLMSNFPFGSLTGLEIRITRITFKEVITDNYEWEKVN